jgi:DNA-binding CsgD family transcriptional regulator
MFGGDRYGTRVLSERERRVIELVAQGLKNIEVAEALGTTEFVVKNYLRVIYDKLGLWNRVELALWYEKHRHEIPGNGTMSTVFFHCDRCHLECRVDSEAPDSSTAQIIIRHCSDGKDIAVLGTVTRFQERHGGVWVDVERRTDVA